MYVMGAASSSHPLPRKSYDRDAQGYEWRHNAGLNWIHATPLFIHLFPQAWLDLRELDDGYISKRDHLDYFENTHRAIAIQRTYAFLNPRGFTGYGKDIWGLSACEGPDGGRHDDRKRAYRFDLEADTKITDFHTRHAKAWFQRWLARSAHERIALLMRQ